jgi:hypothetical protein
MKRCNLSITSGTKASTPIAATILATLGSIELHLFARASSRAGADEALEVAVGQVVGVIGADIVQH